MVCRNLEVVNGGGQRIEQNYLRRMVEEGR